MISHSFAKKMIDFVKENRRIPEEEAVTYSVALLFLRDLQSLSRQEDSGRGSH